MEKKIIEQYLQIMIDNGYKSYLDLNVDMFKIGGCFLTDNIHGVFMQGESIKAVAKFIRNKLKLVDKLDEKYEQVNIKKFNNQTKFVYLENKKSINWFNDIYPKEEDKILYRIENELCRQLAYSIKDNKTEEYLKKIILF